MLPDDTYVEHEPYVFWRNKVLYINSLQLEREFTALMNRVTERMTVGLTNSKEIRDITVTERLLLANAGARFSKYH